MRFVRTVPRPPRRPGFTLTELLVVIAIIVILAALSAGAVFYWIANQQSRNTQATLRAVNTAFQKQWSWVAAEAKKEGPSSAVVSLAGDLERARVLWVKIRLMEAFPMAYAEINGTGNPKAPDPINTFLNTYIAPKPRKYFTTYQKLSGGKFAATNPATESAACLLMALSVSRGGTSLSPDQLGSAVADTDGDGVNEIVDAWRNPVAFYRFAWGTTKLAALGTPPSVSIQGLNPAPAGTKGFTLADPLDPAGTLLAWKSASPASSSAYEGLFHKINYSATSTYYVVPVIVANGKDEKLGLMLPTPATSCASAGLVADGSGADADDLYSLNLKGN